MARHSMNVPLRLPRLAGEGVPKALAPALRLVLPAIGIGIAAAGQAATTRALPASPGWFASLADWTEEAYTQPEVVLAGMVLLVIGAALFAIGVSDVATAEEARDVLGRTRAAPRLRLPFYVVSAVVFVIAAAVFAVVIYKLYDRQYSNRIALMVPLTIALAASPFAARDLLTYGWRRPRWSWWLPFEGLLIAAFFTLFVVICLQDLDDWRWAALGDEYAFYGAARLIAEGERFNFFSQEGVYNVHPVLSSAWQALFLKFSEGDVFAWKLSEVVLVAITLVFFYLLVHELFGWRPAAFAAGLLAASHYLIAFVHTGFNNVDALLPTVLSLWLLVVGLRRNSTLALFGAGLAAGLGFYVYYPARAAIVIIAIYLLFMGPRAWKPRILGPIALAFAMAVAPIFSIHGWTVIDAVLGQSAAEHDPTVTGDRLARFGHNIVPSLMAFNFTPNPGRGFSGSLMDPVSAVLFVLGLGVAVAKWRNAAWRLFLIWWFVAVAASGFASPRPEVANTRLFFALPPAIAMAGLAFDRMLLMLPWRPARPVAQAGYGVACLTLLMIPVLYLNLDRVWHDTPTKYGTSVDAVVVRGVLSDECMSQPARTIVVTPFPDGLLAPVFDSYQLGAEAPLLIGFDAVVSPRGVFAEGEYDGCIVVHGAGDPNAVVDVIGRLTALFPDKSRQQLFDPSGQRAVIVFR
jgi:hypothetical protein